MAASGSISSIVLSRYANALLDLAEKTRIINKIQGDVKDLSEILEGSDDLMSVIRSPLVGKSRQHAVMAELTNKMKCQGLTQNFIGVLIENRRLNLLPELLRAIERLINERSGVQIVQVKTAVGMSEVQKKELKTKISTALGGDVSLEVNVDPSILGGMVVRIGSKMIDDSVRRKLERLKSSLIKRENSNIMQTVKEVV